MTTGVLIPIPRGGMSLAAPRVYRIASPIQMAAHRGMEINTGPWEWADSLCGAQPEGRNLRERERQTHGGNYPTFDFKSSALNQAQPPFLKNWSHNLIQSDRRSRSPFSTSEPSIILPRRKSAEGKMLNCLYRLPHPAGKRLTSTNSERPS